MTVKIGNIGLVLFWLTLTILNVQSCDTPLVEKKQPGNFEPTKYVYQQPEKLNDGLNVSTLALEKMDEDKICQLVEDFPELWSMIILKNEKLVFEDYFQNQDQDTLHKIQSCTKSFTSALLGIAIDWGFIQSVDQPIFDFFPDYLHLKTEKNQHIKIHHLLSMTSGLRWDEGRDNLLMYNSSDWVEYVLKRNMAEVPGEKFLYNSGCSMLLGAVISNSIKSYILYFARDNLFAPLGITNFRWIGQRLLLHTGGGLKLRSRDMAKMGLLFQNRGLWQGKRIISEAWIGESTKNQIPGGAGGVRYGFQWWIQTFYTAQTGNTESFSARGLGGQFIYVFPGLELILITTQDPEDHDSSISKRIFLLITEYLLPAVL